MSPHSREDLDVRWASDSGARDRVVRSEGRAKPSSKSSSSMVLGGGLGAAGLGRAVTLIVDTPSSSSSSSVDDESGGRMVYIWEEFLDGADLAAMPSRTCCAFAPPVFPKFISISQSSSSSLSDSASDAWMGSPSGKSKSASGHSSLGRTMVGAGMVVIVVNSRLVVAQY